MRQTRDEACVRQHCDSPRLLLTGTTGHFAGTTRQLNPMIRMRTDVHLSDFRRGDVHHWLFLTSQATMTGISRWT
jgi:hypothetical protein